MKKGFTLIELMVVIVIIGILAAIAVPKMFGMSAKAKAAEVGPAAGTWVKLEQSYATEMNGAGSWLSIGYNAPGTGGVTTNFTYSQAAAATATTANWTATNIPKLNDCAPAKTWVINLTNASAVAGAFDPAFDPVVADANCKLLTPSFDKIK